MINYEKSHIYRMITAKEAIYRSFNVEWKSNKRLHNSDAFNSNSNSNAFNFKSIIADFVSDSNTDEHIHNEIDKLLNEIAV